MDIKKLITIICVSVLIGLFGFIGVWFFMNFDTVKLAISGTQIYTQEDLDSAYQDGYDNALENKTDYDTLIGDYREQIASLTDEVSKLKYNLSITEDTISKNESEINSLNTQLTEKENELTILRENENINLEKIEELELEIEYLTTSIESKQKEITLLTKQKNDYLESINYYKNFISTLETETSAIATFEYDGQVIHMEILTKGSCATFNQPTDTEYLKFNFWMVNGVEVDLASFPVNTNTTFVANIEKSYDVAYYVDNEKYVSKIVLEGASLPTIDTPTKDGYTFLGWSLDKVTLVGADYVVESDIELYAIFEAFTWNVFYMDDTELVYMEEVKTDNNPIGYTLTSTDRKVFKGWSIDGINVIDVTSYLISEDTTFIAVCDIYYLLEYVVDNTTINSFYILNNTSPQLISNPEKNGYTFAGWSVDGINIVEISNSIITEDIKYIAVFTSNIAYLSNDSSLCYIQDNIDEATSIVIDYYTDNIQKNYIVNGENVIANANSIDLTDTSSSNTIELYYVNNTVYILSTAQIYALSLRGTFQYFENVTSISFNNFNTSLVEDMAYAFNRCSSLVSLDLSSFETSNVKDMSYMLYYCSELKNVNLSKFCTNKVETMEGMFGLCNNIETLDLSSFYVSNVESISMMFSQCNELKNIYVSSQWCISISCEGGYAFYNCKNLPNYSSSCYDETCAHYGSGGYLTLVEI